MFEQTKFKKFTKKTTSVLMVALLSGVFLSSSRFNNNSEVLAIEEVARSDYYEPNDITIISNDTTTLDSGNYKVQNATLSSGLKITPGAVVHLWLEGKNSFIGSKGASITQAGSAGIEVPEDATLYLHGSGNLTAIGGQGFTAYPGHDGFIANYEDIQDPEKTDLYNNTIEAVYVAAGGSNIVSGGYGGCGAGGGGAAIGTAGGIGGNAQGEDGGVPPKCGKVFFLSTGEITLVPGKGGDSAKGGDGRPSSKGGYDHVENLSKIEIQKNFEFGGGGGGGGGGADGAGFGSGGAGGGAGGAGGRVGEKTMCYDIPLTLYLSDYNPRINYYVFAFNGPGGGGGGGGGGKSNKIGGGGGGAGGCATFERTRQYRLNTAGDYGDPATINLYDKNDTTFAEYTKPQNKNFAVGGKGGKSTDGENGETYGENIDLSFESVLNAATDKFLISYNSTSLCGIDSSLLSNNIIKAYIGVGCGGRGGKAGSERIGGKGGADNSHVYGTTFKTLTSPTHYGKVSVLYGKSSPGGSGGKGGDGGEEVISGTAYRTESSKFTSGKTVVDINNTPLIIKKAGDKLIADSSTPADLRKYTWEIDGTSVKTDKPEELPLHASYIGKSIKLISDATDATQDGKISTGHNEVSYTFTINLDDCTLKHTNEYITTTDDDKYVADYTGSKIDPKLEVFYHSIKLVENVHYKVAYPSDEEMTNPGTVTLKIQSNGDPGITGPSDSAKLEFEYTILSKKLQNSNFTMSPQEFEYNASDQKPTVTGRGIEGNTLRPDTDYSVLWPDEEYTSAGDHTFQIKGLNSGGYEESTLDFTYKINPRDISNDTSTKIKVLTKEFDFTGNPITPEIEVTNSYGTLNESVDYEIEWPVDTTSTGEKIFKIHGKGNYKGTLEGSYSINGIDITGFTAFAEPSTFKYNRRPQTPNVTVYKNDGTTQMQEGTEYDITWPEDIINSGDKEIIINGKNATGYKGTITTHYTINPVDVSDIDISISSDKFYYTGSAMAPELTVKYLDEDLVEGTDYITRISNDQISPGEKSITLSFQGNYTGSKTLIYTIQEAKYTCTYGDGLSIDVIDLLNNSLDKNNLNFYISSNNNQLSAEVTSEGVLEVNPSSPVGEYNITVTEQNSESTVHVQITIEKATPIVWIDDKFAIYSGETINIDAPSIEWKNGENLKTNIYYDYYSDETCTSLLTDLPRNVGTYYVKATIEAPNDNYNKTTTDPGLILISKAEQILEGSTYYYGKPGNFIYMDAQSNVATDLLYDTEDENIAQIENNGKITFINEGQTKITAYAPETQNYNDATLEATVEVSRDASASAGSSNISTSNNVSSINQNNDSNPSDKSENNDSNTPTNAADKIWNKILETGDKSFYIIIILSVMIGIAILVLILTKRKK